MFIILNMNIPVVNYNKQKLFKFSTFRLHRFKIVNKYALKHYQQDIFKGEVERERLDVVYPEDIPEELWENEEEFSKTYHPWKPVILEPQPSDGFTEEFDFDPHNPSAS